MNHGRRRENISLDANDYQTFIKLLQETDERWNIQIAAYCLTPHKGTCFSYTGYQQLANRNSQEWQDKVVI
jgi:hypothetical protein